MLPLRQTVKNETDCSAKREHIFIGRKIKINLTIDIDTVSYFII